jgi:hypothetical protein
LASEIPNDDFRIFAADHTECGVSLGTEVGQGMLEPLPNGVDLLILDNLSTLVTNGSESASDAAHCPRRHAQHVSGLLVTEAQIPTINGRRPN